MVERAPIKDDPAVIICPINPLFLGRAEETVPVASHNGNVSKQGPFFEEERSPAPRSHRLDSILAGERGVFGRVRRAGYWKLLIM